MKYGMMCKGGRLW